MSDLLQRFQAARRGVLSIALIIMFASPMAWSEQEVTVAQPLGKGIESSDYLWNSRDIAALELEGDLANGKKIYQDGCAKCHGYSGVGKLDGSVPKIAGQHATVVIKQLDDYLQGARDSLISFNALLRILKTPQAMSDVAEYVASMPPLQVTGLGPGDNLELGKQLQERDCGGCHRGDGRGSGEDYFPIIAGQHFDYLYAQIRDMALKRRRNTLPVMVEIVKNYSSEEILHLADYLSRMEWPTVETEY